MTSVETLAEHVEPALARPLAGVELFTSRIGGELALGFGAPNGLAVIAPLPLGVTLDAISTAPTQREFLDFISADNYLIAYDQRGAGESDSSLMGERLETLGADVWRVADQAGVKRAILYGVFDSGASVIEAARQHPERVLGMILNFVPPAFGAQPGVSDGDVEEWLDEHGDVDAAAILQTLGLPERDIAALGHAPRANRGAADRLRLLNRWTATDLATCSAPLLVIEPRRRAFFAGWGEALRHTQPAARVIYSVRGARALGAIDAFLSSLTDEDGRRASYLTAEQAQTMSAAEDVGREIRTILVPVDDEFAGVRAVDLACRIAQAQEANIAVVTVAVVPRTRALDDVPPEIAARAERVLSITTAAAARHGVHYTSFMQTSRGYVDGIVQASKQAAADMVVLPNPTTASDRNNNTLAELFARSPCEVLIDRSGRAI